MTFLFEKSNLNSKNSNGIYDFQFYDGTLRKGAF